MPDIIDLVHDLSKVREALELRLPDVAAVLTVTAKAIAERTIKEKGVGKYSENRIPIWFLQGKELNNQGKQFLAAKKKKDQQNTKTVDGVTTYPADYGSNWKELRQAEGLQTSYVDLSHTNKMWANMGPVGFERRGDVFVVPLGATNVEAQKEMDYNRERYGDFILAAISTPENEAILRQVVIDEVEKVLQQLIP